jgi:NAD(P)-dependent dehydrogenase (short-subunit alcohol dehydrogenase family)
MTSTTNAASTGRRPELDGQTVVVIGGSAGIGLETARQARAEGAEVILTARNQDRLNQAAAELGAQQTAAFDAVDFHQLENFFEALSTPIDHLLVTGPGPSYALLADFDLEKARRDVEAHLLLPIQVARNAQGKVRPGGTLLFMGGTGGRATTPGLAFVSALTAAMPALTKNLALELAPIRVNLIAAGFVDTPLSAALLGDQLDARPRGAPRHPADPSGRRAGRHRRPGRPPHDQQRRHGCYLRHRRRPATRSLLNTTGNADSNGEAVSYEATAQHNFGTPSHPGWNRAASSGQLLRRVLAEKP